MPITLPFFGIEFRPSHLFVSIVLVGLAPAIWVGANLETWIGPAPGISRLGDAPTGGNADRDTADLPDPQPMTWHPPYKPDVVLPSIGSTPGRTVPYPGLTSRPKGTPAPATTAAPVGPAASPTRPPEGPGPRPTTGAPTTAPTGPPPATGSPAPIPSATPPAPTPPTPTEGTAPVTRRPTFDPAPETPVAPNPTGG